MNPENLRIGLGWDRHRLAPGRPLLLGGVHIPSPFGLAGHSDGDVLLHAAIDAILGAAGGDDIGALFPSDDLSFEDADSRQLTRVALREVRARGYRVLGLDAVVAMERPRLTPFRRSIRENMADLLGVDPQRVNVKAKSGEGIGVVGRSLVIEATAVALLLHGNAHTGDAHTADGRDAREDTVTPPAQ